MGKVRKPKVTDDGLFGWQESYADALDYNYVVNTLVWERMYQYSKRDDNGLFKYYPTYHEAMTDYYKGTQHLIRGVLSGKYKEGYGMIYGRILEDYVYTMEANKGK